MGNSVVAAERGLWGYAVAAAIRREWFGHAGRGIVPWYATPLTAAQPAAAIR